MITENLPKGWMIRREMVPAGMDVDFAYVAYRWETRTIKKLFRKPVTRTGWFETGFRSRWEDETYEWVIGTAGQTQDLFDIVAKGYGHVSILLNGEVCASTKVCEADKEAVAYATLRWGEKDSLTYDNAFYASATRRKES